MKRVLSLALLLAAGLTWPGGAGADPARGEAPRERRIEARWRRPAGCPQAPAPAPVVDANGARVWSAVSQRPPCRITDTEAQDRWLPGGVWVDWNAPRPQSR